MRQFHYKKYKSLIMIPGLIIPLILYPSISLLSYIFLYIIADAGSAVLPFKLVVVPIVLLFLFPYWYYRIQKCLITQLEISEECISITWRNQNKSIIELVDVLSITFTSFNRATIKTNESVTHISSLDTSLIFNLEYHLRRTNMSNIKIMYHLSNNKFQFYEP